ncbi:MAG: hypothetical protein R3B93_23470 [Bacteroidia bacterium]
MYKLGQLYAQKLNEPDSAVKTFEALLDRYEDSIYTPGTLCPLQSIRRQVTLCRSS